MRAASPFEKVLFFALVIGAGVYLLFLMDDGLGLGWPANVVRNWQDFGFLNLHGKLAYNPGGHGIAEQPQIYPGMSPVFLYPAYLVTQLLHWTGLDTLSFFAVLLAVLFWAAWKLMGGDNVAALLAGAVILCPGYMQSVDGLDPNTLSVLPAIPYAVIALAILRRPKFTNGLALALLLITAGFMSLNWTTAWVCGPCFFLFLGTRGVNRRGLVFLVAVMAIAVPSIAALSFAAKSGGHLPGTGAGGSMLGAYLWGNAGYGEGLTTARAYLRLAFYNGASLFPMWLGLIWVAANRVGGGGRISWIAFAPLAMSVVNMLVMRNYFGHHPPMAGAVLLVGLVFSVALLRAPAPEGREEARQKYSFKQVLVFTALCFAYGLIFMVLFRANGASRLSLDQLIRNHTARPETVVVLEKNDPVVAAQASRLEEPFDRHITVITNLQDLAGEKSQWVLLSSARLDDSFSLVAQSEAPAKSGLSKVGDWFNRAIARRNPGDRIDVAAVYYLYAQGR